MDNEYNNIKTNPSSYYSCSDKISACNYKDPLVSKVYWDIESKLIYDSTTGKEDALLKAICGETLNVNIQQNFNICCKKEDRNNTEKYGNRLFRVKSLSDGQIDYIEECMCKSNNPEQMEECKKEHCTDFDLGNAYINCKFNDEQIKRYSPTAIEISKYNDKIRKVFSEFLVPDCYYYLCSELGTVKKKKEEASDIDIDTDKSIDYSKKTLAPKTNYLPIVIGGIILSSLLIIFILSIVFTLF